MAFISKEIPSGPVNGSNKVYTTANTLSVLDDVFVDGSIYTHITITGTNEITLADAPTVSIFVDYYDAPPVNPSTGFLLVSDLRNILERYLDDDLTNVSDEVFLDFANDLQIDLYDRITEINGLDYIKSQDFTYSTNTIALESDFLSADDLNTGLYKMKDGKPFYKYPNINVGSSIKGWYIEGTDLKLVGNFSNKDDLSFMYLPTSYDLNTTADSTIIPDNRKYYPSVRNMLKMLYSGWSVGNDDDEVRSSAKYEQDLQKLADYIGKVPNAINLYEI